MKINYFITHFPYKNNFDDSGYFTHYQYGGAELAAYHLALEMAKRNEVNVFTTSIDSKDSFEEYCGVNLYRYGTKFKIEKGNISFGLFLKPFKHGADIVHGHFSTPPGEIAALIYAKKKKLPFVLTYHGDWQESFGGFVRRTALSFYNKHLLNKVLSHANVIISPSESYINKSRFLGKYSEKVVVIPNGINIEDFDIPYSREDCRKKLGLPIDKHIILFVGSLTPTKACDVLVKSMRIIAKEVPDTKLVFVGSGVMRDELLELSKKSGIKKNVKFAGFVEKSLSLYYKAADVFCLPSKIEVFPLVLLEASASGLPMVVSDLNTFKCFIEDGRNGLFTKRGSEDSLANAIIYLLKNEDAREKMGRNAKEKVKNYTWERIAKETKKVYEEII